MGYNKKKTCADCIFLVRETLRNDFMIEKHQRKEVKKGNFNYLKNIHPSSTLKCLYSHWDEAMPGNTNLEQEINQIDRKDCPHFLKYSKDINNLVQARHLLEERNKQEARTESTLKIINSALAGALVGWLLGNLDEILTWIKNLL